MAKGPNEDLKYGTKVALTYAKWHNLKVTAARYL